MMEEEEDNKDRWKNIQNKENQNKVDNEEDKLILIILIDFPNAVKPALYLI